MISYLTLSSRYLSAHKKKTRFALMSIITAVTLVVGIFSMLDTLVKFEKAQVLKTQGNYHILIRNVSDREIDLIDSRIDVQNTGTLKDLGEGKINGEKCVFGALDEKFSQNLNFVLTEGKYPSETNEIMLEKWFMETATPTLKLGDTVTIELPNSKVSKFVISGAYKDWGVTKAVNIPIIFLSMNVSKTLTPVSKDYFILFKNGVNIIKAENELKEFLALKDSRIGRNEGLLMFMLQTKNNKALRIYAIGAILFVLVLITAVVMIYNTFNLSVMERVHQFGLLRCIGASQEQIKRLVRKEGFLLTLKAVPIGIVMGTMMTTVCLVILKYYSIKQYADISVINISWIGVVAGMTVGMLTVFLAMLLPAQKAARVSPVSALTGNIEIKISKETKKGFLMRLFPPEVAIGINNVVFKKMTLVLMSSSIALSIIIFMGFSLLVNPMLMGVRPTMPYTADISLTAEQMISHELYNKISALKGVKKVFGRMSKDVSVTFNETRLTDEYRKLKTQINVEDNGLFIPPETSMLISYDNIQLKWIKEYLEAGEVEEKKLNEQNGIIAIRKTYRENILIKTNNLQLGDKVYIQTALGTREFIIIAIVDTIPYSGETLNMSTFITTEKIFTEITGDSEYKTIDIQLERNNQDKTTQAIRSMINNSINFQDKRQFNSESNNVYMTIALFIYGFIVVIALISILNIVNTMNTSIATKIRYLGVMRAIGMSGDQLNRMVLAEALFHTISGCLMGCALGTMLHRTLSYFLLNYWKFPLVQLIIAVTYCILAAVFSILIPLKEVKERNISEIVGTL